MTRWYAGSDDQKVNMVCLPEGRQGLITRGMQGPITQGTHAPFTRGYIYTGPVYQGLDRV